jgi:hypothetical protein
MTEAKSSVPSTDVALSISEELSFEAERLALLHDYYAKRPEVSGLTQRASPYNLCLRQARDCETNGQSTSFLFNRAGRILRGSGNLIIGRAQEPVVRSESIGDVRLGYYGRDETALSEQEKALYRLHKEEIKEYIGEWGSPLSLKLLLRAADALPGETIFKADGKTPFPSSVRQNYYSMANPTSDPMKGVRIRDPEVLAFFNRYMGPGAEVADVVLEVISTNQGTGSRTYQLHGIPLSNHHPKAWADRPSARSMVEQLQKDEQELRRIKQRMGEFALKRKRLEEDEAGWKYPRLTFLTAEQQGLTSDVSDGKKKAKKRAKKEKAEKAEKDEASMDLDG